MTIISSPIRKSWKLGSELGLVQVVFSSLSLHHPDPINLPRHGNSHAAQVVYRAGHRVAQLDLGVDFELNVPPLGPVSLPVLPNLFSPIVTQPKIQVLE